MKKLFCAVLSVFILSSCNRVDFQPDFPVCPEGQIEVTYNETDYTADLIFEKDVLNIRVVKPEALNGFEITVSPEEIIVMNDSLALKYDKEKSEKLFPILQIYDVLIQLNSLKPVFNDNNGNLVAQFDVNQNECYVMLDKQSEKLLKIEYKGLVFNFIT